LKLISIRALIDEIFQINKYPETSACRSFSGGNFINSIMNNK
jgi:hypothetical protein